MFMQIVREYIQQNEAGSDYRRSAALGNGSPLWPQKRSPVERGHIQRDNFNFLLSKGPNCSARFGLSRLLRVSQPPFCADHAER